MLFINQVLIDSWSRGGTPDNTSMANDERHRTHDVPNCSATQDVLYCKASSRGTYGHDPFL